MTTVSEPTVSEPTVSEPTVSEPTVSEPTVSEPTVSEPTVSEPTGWPSDAQRDRLIGDWHLHQRKGGHRTSTDDLITAWYAVHRRPHKPTRYLDLGCGVGSVFLMVCHKLRPPVALGVEAQEQSAAMATRSVDELPPHSCQLEIKHSDFRELQSDAASFDLVTGSPPYFPLNAGVLPVDSQRRACRFEVRGGVEAYLEAATRFMSPEGRFYLVFQTRWNERVLAAAAQHKLHRTGQADFLMRRDKQEPFLSVFEFSRSPVAKVDHFSCPVREADGAISSEYQKIRYELGVS